MSLPLLRVRSALRRPIMSMTGSTQAAGRRAFHAPPPMFSRRGTQYNNMLMAGAVAAGAFAVGGGAIWPDFFQSILPPSLSYLLPTTQHCDTSTPTPAALDAETRHASGITASSPMRLRMEQMIRAKQEEIVASLQTLEPNTKFIIDSWTRPEHGGGGVSCVLQDGETFEKAGVNISIVYGQLPRAAILKMRADHKNLDPSVDSLDFFAAGLSMVLHPVNPHAPTVHLNYRYFETMHPDGTTQSWWFGGGTDLTPSYLYDSDAIHFHQTIKSACDRHDPSYYPRFKKWCDDYFFIRHRGEARGVGGIFFDDLDDKDPEQLFSFATDCLSSFLPSYMPIVVRRKDHPYTEAEKMWQQLRRGRYVEFNLVHDRGTAFGLNTPGARVESILMSLPLTAGWRYMHSPEKGSREERLLEVLREPREWV